MYNKKKVVGTSRNPQRTEQSPQHKMPYNVLNVSITGIHAGTTHFTCESRVLPVYGSSGNAYLKCYEADAGPEEPRLEEYTDFYTDQGMERPEYKKWDIGIYSYNSPIQYDYVINMGNGILKLYHHCYLMRGSSLEELSGARKDSWAHTLLTWGITDDPI